MIQKARYFAVKFLIFLASYLIRVGEATKAKERSNSLPYRKFKVDPPPLKEPLVEVEPCLDYQRLVKKEGILPIKRRVELACRISCPDCGAPSDYIYSNGHGPAPKEDKGDFVSQFQCKVYRRVFRRKARKKKPSYYCPYCGRPLEKMQKENSVYTIYNCNQQACPYRVQKLKNLDSLKNPNGTDRKISYLFREPKFAIRSLEVSSLERASGRPRKNPFPQVPRGPSSFSLCENRLIFPRDQLLFENLLGDRAVPSDNSQLDHLFFFSPLSPPR